MSSSSNTLGQRGTIAETSPGLSVSSQEHYRVDWDGDIFIDMVHTHIMYVEGDLGADAILGMAPRHPWLSEQRPEPSKRGPRGLVSPRSPAKPNVSHVSLTPHHLGP